MKLISRTLLGACLTLVGTADAEDVVAYRGATIETVSKAGTIKNGTIVVRDGKIDAVGTDVAIPTNARIVDVAGQTVIPGIVDPYHPVSLSGTPAGPAFREVRFGGRVFRIPIRRTVVSTAFTRIVDELDPVKLKNDLKPQARNGVAFANLVTRGFGQAAHARVTPDDAANSIVSGDGLLFMAVTNNPTSLDALRKGLGVSAKPSSSRPTVPTSRRGTPTSTRRTTSRSTSSGPTAALWKDIREGKKPLILNINNGAGILHALKVLKGQDKVKVVIVATGPNVFDTLRHLKKSKVSLVISPQLDTAPRSADRINVPNMLAKAGMDFGFSMSLNSSISTMPDTPLFPVSMLVKTGLDRKIALEALTIRPAKMLGLEKSLGSIEKGKQANMIFVDGDPLDASARIQQVLVEGKTVHEN